MNKKIVLTTTDDSREAEKIGEKLVKKKLAACVNIVPKIESIYRWKGNIEKETEKYLFIKTIEENVEEIKSRILELHSYENPEILVIAIEDGSKNI